MLIFKARSYRLTRRRSACGPRLNYGTGRVWRGPCVLERREENLFIFRPLDHFRRVLNSGKLLMMDLPYTPGRCWISSSTCCARRIIAGRTSIRPLIYKSSEVIGVRLHDLEADFTMFAQPFGSYIESEEGSRYVLVLAAHRRQLDRRAAKSRGYANSAFIKTDAMLSGDEALVLNQNRHISEGSAENFFLVRDGMAPRRSTPASSRHHPADRPPAGREMDVEVRCADRPDQCSSPTKRSSAGRASGGRHPEIDHRRSAPSIGPVVRQLRDLFDIVRGKVALSSLERSGVRTESHAAAQGKTGQQQGHAG